MPVKTKEDEHLTDTVDKRSSSMTAEQIDALIAENNALRASQCMQVAPGEDGLIASSVNRYVVNCTMVGGKNPATGDYGFHKDKEYFPPEGTDIGRLLRVGAIRPMGTREFIRPIIQTGEDIPYDTPRGVEPIILHPPLRPSDEADNGTMTNAMRKQGVRLN